MHDEGIQPAGFLAESGNTITALLRGAKFEFEQRIILCTHDTEVVGHSSLETHLIQELLRGQIQNEKINLIRHVTLSGTYYVDTLVRTTDFVAGRAPTSFCSQTCLQAARLGRLYVLFRSRHPPPGNRFFFLNTSL